MYDDAQMAAIREVDEIETLKDVLAKRHWRLRAVAMAAIMYLQVQQSEINQGQLYGHQGLAKANASRTNWMWWAAPVTFLIGSTTTIQKPFEANMCLSGWWRHETNPRHHDEAEARGLVVPVGLVDDETDTTCADHDHGAPPTRPGPTEGPDLRAWHGRIIRRDLRHGVKRDWQLSGS